MPKISRLTDTAAWTIAVAITAVLLGATPSARAADGQRFYDIELILFERNTPAGDEYWPEDAGIPERAGTIGRLNSRNPPAGIRLLPQSGWRLGPVAHTLRRRGLDPVFHIAWRQAVPARGSRSWLWVANNRVQGRIRMTRGRYLHLDADLLLGTPGSAQSYRVTGQRRMRSAELHHLDHPKLGILVRADPYEPPAPPPKATAKTPAEESAAETATESPTETATESDAAAGQN